jgi:hypothetical protein
LALGDEVQPEYQSICTELGVEDEMSSPRESAPLPESQLIALATTAAMQLDGPSLAVYLEMAERQGLHPKGLYSRATQGVGGMPKSYEAFLASIEDYYERFPEKPAPPTSGAPPSEPPTTSTD